MQKKIFLFVLLGVPFFSSTLFATPEPFYTKNQHPHIQMIGLPLLKKPTIEKTGTTKTSLILNIANHFNLDTSNGETIVLDGETYRYDLLIVSRYKKIEYGIAIPFIQNSGGHFDSLINSFHKITGLPDADRSKSTNDQLDYTYTESNYLHFKKIQPTSGIGDLSLLFGYPLLKSSRTNLTARLEIKLSTGEKDVFVSTESTDVSLFLAGSHDIATYHLLSFFSIGGIAIGEVKLLPTKTNPYALFGHLGFAYDHFSMIIPKIQIDINSPIYKNSVLKQINSWSAQLTAGITLKWNDNINLDIGISEDLIIDASPDVVFNMGLHIKWN